MRTVTITKTYYKFDELPEDIQDKAVENLYDLNVNYEWWECTYDDAKNIGLEIKEFDTDRGGYCKGKLLDSADKVAASIIGNHGEACDTYKLAKQLLKDWTFEDTEEAEYKREDLETEFERALCEEYLSILRRDYEYLTSREAIIESIQANDYEFTEEGKLS